MFTRNSNPAAVKATQEAARKYVESKFGGRVEMCTPIRRTRPEALANGSALANGNGNATLQREESNPRKRSLSRALDAAEWSQPL